jgi:homoserine O-succinyltransferase
MTALIDWARYNTASTFWSCLAAHAAVLHLDKIERRRLPSKRSGAYLCQTQKNQGALPQSLLICHSRLNEVPKSALEEAGYRILSQSIADEVDIFTKAMPSRFLFLQGHPEYDVQSLAREYRRDVDRYLNGIREEYPAIPESYFDEATTEAYQQFSKKAQVSRKAELIESFPVPGLRRELSQDLAKSAAAIFAFWMEQISDVVAARQQEPKRRA